MTQASNPQIVQANGVDICMQTLGDPGDAPILLIHGAAASLLAWPDEFCERLAAGGRFVIRYDHRDMGQSVSYEPGAPPYGLRDLIADAVGLLDALDMTQANLVGISMGGGIAQTIALDYPERVASLTLMATSPGGDDLPPPSEEFLAYVNSGDQPDWSDRNAIAEHLVEMIRVFNGDSADFDEAGVRDMVQRDLDRSTANVVSSLTNHFVMDTDGSDRQSLSDIDTPTLVIHGTRDPIFPIAHAHALVDEIPGAELLTLDGVGHLVPWQRLDIVIPAILKHTSRGQT